MYAYILYLLRICLFSLCSEKKLIFWYLYILPFVECFWRDWLRPIFEFYVSFKLIIYIKLGFYLWWVTWLMIMFDSTEHFHYYRQPIPLGLESFQCFISFTLSCKRCPLFTLGFSLHRSLTDWQKKVSVILKKVNTDHHQDIIFY